MMPWKQILGPLGKVAAAAFVSAFGAFLGRVLEPFLKWLLYLGFRFLIWILPDGRVEDSIKELFEEVRKVYDEEEPRGRHNRR